MRGPTTGAGVEARPEAAPAWRGTVAGLCASLVGIGLARFAYTPLLPGLIEAGWFAPGAAAYLGAANLAGYLAGALLAPWAAARLPAPQLLRALMLVATTAFAACASPLSYLWFFAWRFAAGLAGGGLMALAAPTVLARVKPDRRGIAGGVIFTGVGLGIAASGTLVPVLMGAGLGAAWLGLAAISLLLTLVAWGGWPGGISAGSAPAAGSAAPAAAAPLGREARGLLAAYALIAVGLVPHMIFLVDFAGRALGLGLQAGALFWVVFGLGATAGPLAAGAAADRIGFRRALRLGMLAQIAGAALPALTAAPGALALSALVMGALVPGVVVLVIGRVNELVAPAGRRAAWSLATTAFATGQATAAYAFSFLFARGVGYGVLFAAAAVAALAALAIEFASSRARAQAAPGA